MTPTTYESFSTKTLLKLVGILGLCFLAFLLKHFILIILVAVVIASFTEPAVLRLRKIHIPRYISVPFIFLVGISVLILAVALLVPVFAKEINELVTLLPKGSDLARGITSFNRFGFSEMTLQKFTGSSNPLTIVQSIMSFISSSGVASFASGLLDTTLVIILAFYLAITEKGVDQFLKVITPAEYETRVLGIWERSEKKIGDWFGGQVIAALIVGIMTYIGLLILNVPYAAVLAFAVAVFDLVPFGTLIGAVPSAIIGFLSGGFALAFWILVLYFIIHEIEVYIIQPLVIKKTVGIPIVIMLISVIAWGILGGVLGILISIPCAVVVMELIDQKKTETEIVEQETQA